jgi:hypothetical protein
VRACHLGIAEIERLERFGVRMLMVHEGRTRAQATELIGFVDSNSQ